MTPHFNTWDGDSVCEQSKFIYAKFQEIFPNSIWFLDTIVKILRFIPRPLENKRERYVFANITLCSKFYD